MTKTLTGVRIVDLTRVLAGPYATMLLADMGAEVIKIEDPAGDPTRTLGPPWIGPDSTYFLSVNRSKRSVAVDLRTESGREALLSLVETADVIIDNLRPGALDRLGLSDDVLVHRNPALIRCSISGYGSDGPYREWPAFDLVLQAVGGGMSITGSPDGPPARAGLPIGDLAGGLMAALAVTAALARRERTGHAERIEVSLLDVQASLLTYVMQGYWASGHVPGPLGAGHQTAVPYGVYRCGDGGWIVLGILTDAFWSKCAAALGFAEWTPEWPTLQARQAARAEIDRRIAERLLEHDRATWLDRLRAADVPCGPVNTLHDVATDPQLLSRRMLTELDDPHPRAGRHPVLGNPIHVWGETTSFRPAPDLGQDNSRYGFQEFAPGWPHGTPT